jgi:hypothetical protein
MITEFKVSFNIANVNQKKVTKKSGKQEILGQIVL